MPDPSGSLLHLWGPLWSSAVQCGPSERAPPVRPAPGPFPRFSPLSLVGPASACAARNGASRFLLLFCSSDMSSSSPLLQSRGHGTDGNEGRAPLRRPLSYSGGMQGARGLVLHPWGSVGAVPRSCDVRCRRLAKSGVVPNWGLGEEGGRRPRKDAGDVALLVIA